MYTQDGMEYLDPWTSRAFAVADHQVAHVYVADPADLERGARALRRRCPGSAEVLDAAARPAYGLDHERAGELVLVAEPDAWFTYYYWLDDARAPDFARLVEIHRKPGYDPAELFFDPEDRLVKAKAGADAGPQEGRPALRDEGRAARPVTGARHPRSTPCPRRRLPDDAVRPPRSAG